MEIGVKHCTASVPGSAVLDLWKFMKETSRRKKKRFTHDEPFLEYDYEFVMVVDPSHLERALDGLLNIMVKWKDTCPKRVREWAEWGDEVIEPKYAEEVEESRYSFFPPMEYFPDILDGASLSASAEAYPDLVFDITSLTSKPIAEFTSFLSSVPKFRGRTSFSAVEHRHAARYALEPYPAIAALWIDEMSTGIFPEDLTRMLSDSLQHLYAREWRTSVVLSSIAGEIVMVDMYEESYKRPAPEMPLGALRDKLTKSGKLETETNEACGQLIKTRNSTVHRGSAPPTIQEASHALRASVQLALSHYL